MRDKAVLFPACNATHFHILLGEVFNQITQTSKSFLSSYFLHPEVAGR